MDAIFGNGSAGHTMSWKPEPTHRGTYGILMTCLITLGLCIWTAIHLNVPARNEKPWHGLRSRGFWQTLSGKWPFEGYEWPGQALRKFCWMIFAFLAPELVAFTAYQQYKDAKSLHASLGPHISDLEAQQHHDRQHKWTTMHSFFAVMGGYAIVFDQETDNFFPAQVTGEREQRDRLTLTPEGLCLLARERPSLIPDQPLAVIQDKSKGSGLAKTIVCFQASWFCVQCLVRFGQHLGISLLELNTFGHAICALLIYYFWWDKPLDVGEPERIVLRNEADFRFVAAMCVVSKLPGSHPELLYWNQEDKRFEFSPWSNWLSRKGLTLPAPKRIERQPMPDGPTHLAFWVSDAPTGAPDASVFRQVDENDLTDGMKLDYFANHDRDPTFIEVSCHDIRRWKHWMRFARENPSIIEHDFDTWNLPLSSLTDRIRNFPRFGNIRSDKALYVGLGVTGLVYGGLHCLAWNATFATDLERLLWRLSSVTVSSTGVLVLLLYTWESSPPFWRLAPPKTRGPTRGTTIWVRRPNADKERCDILDLFVVWPLVLVTIAVRVLYDVFIVSFIALYCLARVFLVVEVFINLVHLPDSAYLVPLWSQYVPHIS